MSPRKLAVLDRIARMRRELELAELARLRQSHAELARESDRLDDAVGAAWRDGCASAADGGAAERFARWADLRQAALDDAMTHLDGRIVEQRDRTALAVGRQDAIATISDRYRTMMAVRKARDPGGR